MPLRRVVPISITSKIDLALNKKEHPVWIAGLKIDALHLNSIETILTLVGAYSFDISSAVYETEILEPDLTEEPIWESIELKAFFLAPISKKKLDDLLKSFGFLNFHLEIKKTKYSQATQSIEAQEIDNILTILPYDSQYKSMTPFSIFLNQGLAFGTGKHPTTRLMLSQLCKHSFKGKTVTDFGCGSGILGIASLAMGAKFCRFIDNDPQALAVTKKNLAVNQMSEKAEVSHINNILLKPSDVIFINIIANTIIELSATIMKLIKPKGDLYVSGILEDQTGIIIDTFINLRLEERANLHGWTALKFSYV